MNNKIIVLGIVFVLVFTANIMLGNSHANLIHHLTAPSGIVKQFEVNITNNQSIATPNPIQVLVKINKIYYSSYLVYNGSFANFEFYYSNGTIIPSWIESFNTSTILVWLKLYSISADSTISIYLGFASSTTNLLNNSGKNGIGEAPQLSKTYAEYDDGANVFNFYDNFAGTSLNTSKWSTSSSGASYSISNGLTVTGNGNGIWFYGKIIQNYPSIFDVYIVSYTSGISQIRNGFSLTQGASTNYDLLSEPSSSTNDEYIESTLGSFGVVSATITYPSSYIQSFAWISTGSEWAQVNYANTLTGTNTQYTIANLSLIHI